MPVTLNANTNMTSTGGLSPAMQTYYDKKLLLNAKPELVHQRFGQKRGMPKNGGKTINFRKFTPFPALTTPLSEGVVPDGQTLAMTELTATVQQYGGYVAISDLLDLTAVDPVLDSASELLGDQAGLSVDTITKDVIHLSTNVQYAGGKLARYQVGATNIISTTELRKAVRTLKKNKARKFQRNGKGYYIAVVSPDSIYDLQSDALWQDVSKYQAGEQIFDGEIGKLFGVIFVETTEAKVFTAANLTAAVRNLTVKSVTEKVITVNEAISADEATALVGRSIIIEHQDGSKSELFTVSACAAGAANAATITIEDSPVIVTIAASCNIYPGEAGAKGLDIQSTVIFGQDSYGVIDIDGSGNVKNLIKPKGSAGTSDPLNQISTSGWKVEAYVAKILQPLWLLRIEHGFTA